MERQPSDSDKGREKPKRSGIPRLPIANIKSDNPEKPAKSPFKEPPSFSELARLVTFREAGHEEKEKPAVERQEEDESLKFKPTERLDPHESAEPAALPTYYDRELQLGQLGHREEAINPQDEARVATGKKSKPSRKPGQPERKKEQEENPKNDDAIIGGEILLHPRSKDNAMREVPLRPVMGPVTPPELTETFGGPYQPEPVLQNETLMESEPPQWQSQPEQQQQARGYKEPTFEPGPEGHPDLEPATVEASEEPESLTVPEHLGIGHDPMELGPEAPVMELTDDPSEIISYAVDQSVEWNPAAAYREYAQHETGAQPSYATNEQMVTRDELDDAAYYAARRGHGRGFITGLLVAGVWGHFRRNGLKRQFNTRLREQDKQLKQAQTALRAVRAERIPQQQPVPVERQSNVVHQPSREKTPETQLERVTRRLKVAERRVEDFRQSAVRTLKRTEPAAPEIIEPLRAPEGDRFEQSEWLTMQVNKRTGRVVEKPAFTYGDEYRHETAPESGPIVQRNAAAGEVALVAEAKSAAPNGAAVQNSGADKAAGYQIPSATMQGPPPVNQQTRDDQTINQPVRSTSTAPIWPYILALVVIVVCLALLLS